jgi:hypothetical protein
MGNRKHAEEKESSPFDPIEVPLNVYAKKTVARTISLKTWLTPDELEAAKEEHLGALAEVRRLQAELDAFKKQRNGEISTAQTRADNSEDLMRNKYEFREQACEEVYDYVARTATTTRLDTGEVVNQRNLSENECQMEIGM